MCICSSAYRRSIPCPGWIGYIKGKSAIHVARHFLKRERNYAGQRLWSRGFFVDTVGRDTEVIRRYIGEQEAEDQRLDQLDLPLNKQTPKNNRPL